MDKLILKTTFDQSSKNMIQILLLGTTIFVILLLPGKSSAQVVQGYVLNELTNEPVPETVVILRDLNKERVRSTSTKENGFFLLNAPKEDEYFIFVRRIGYTDNEGGPFKVGSNDTLTAKILVLEETILMDEVVVAVENYNESVSLEFLEGKNFYNRKKRGLGHFYTREEIQERNLFRLSDLLRMTPGIILRDGQILSSRAKCPMKIVLNGMEMFSDPALTLNNSFQSPGFSIDRLVNVDNVLGVEVYTGLMGQPQQYGTKTRCGTLLIWTR